MIVSTISPAVRPSKFRTHAGPRERRVDIAALLRLALVRNELLLTIAAAPRPSVDRGR